MAFLRLFANKSKGAIDAPALWFLHAALLSTFGHHFSISVLYFAVMWCAARENVGGLKTP